MKLRSLLFVPGDRPERFAKALASGADAIILDLEDSVADGQKPAAREHIVHFLSDRPPATASVWVRVNALDSPFFAADIASIAPLRSDGLMLPKAEGAASMKAFDRAIDHAGGGDIAVLPLVTETPAAIFALGGYAGSSARLAAMSWGAEDLPTAIGAATARAPDGRYTPPFEMVRGLALFAAHAAQVPAIETVYPDFRDEQGLAAYAARGARDGFTGMLAIHPAQIATINAAFSPTAEALAEARAIVEAFAARPEAGALQLHGRMIDTPHLKRARRMLRNAGEGGE